MMLESLLPQRHKEHLSLKPCSSPLAKCLTSWMLLRISFIEKKKEMGMVVATTL